MRLIDADTLPSALFQKHVHDEEELEPMLYFEDAVGVVENAPTIDAIPVEWLRNEMNMADDRGDSEMTDAISWLLQTWQEERDV